MTPPTPTASQYSIVGYATTYRWWVYQRDASRTPVAKNDQFPPPEITVSEMPARLRISQFLILPPHQGFGHGTHLYTNILTACADDPTIIELTVEDPNEAFDALRDTVDYHILYPELLKHKVNINPDPFKRQNPPRIVPTHELIPTKLLHDIRRDYKVEPTQFAHVLEMYLLSRIPFKKRAAGGANLIRMLIKKTKTEDPDERRYYFWRLLTKQRLFKRSKDLLIQLDMSDRIQKLEETINNVEEGYEAQLKGFASREESLKARDEEATELASTAVLDDGEKPTGTPGRDQRAKRKFTVVDDDEEDGSAGAKRTKA